MDLSSLEKEIKKGYNSFKLFEEGLACIQGLKLLQAEIDDLKKSALTAKELTEKAKAEAEEEIKKIGDDFLKKKTELTEAHKKQLDAMQAAHEKEGLNLKDALKKESEKFASLKKENETKSKENVALDKQIENKTESLRVIEDKIKNLKENFGNIFKDAGG